MKSLDHPNSIEIVWVIFKKARLAHVPRRPYKDVQQGNWMMIMMIDMMDCQHQDAG